MDDKTTQEVLKCLIDSVNKADTINKRLIVAIVATVVSMCMLIGFVACVYFTADYGYPQLSQEQTQVQSVEGDAVNG